MQRQQHRLRRDIRSFCIGAFLIDLGHVQLLGLSAIQGDSLIAEPSQKRQTALR
ncbi:hypothetical protein [Pseudomonas sp. ANT_H12B]|uniref:hypothetical protein n=1 Tax=Pseudomonas sp. ANT_H12B TaxID=2597348 RepID=UPI0015B3A431|nr:hypothetical protein [Pseudomonas sp. ANT_H12B]